jgi:transforming growth factor-beta-induced protein
MKRVLFVLLALLVFAIPSFAQDQNIVEIAAGNADFSTLVAAVTAADPSIAEALSGEGPLTVFAPTNAAFEALLAQLNMSAEDLLANTELLNQVLLYHVVSGSVLAADVVGMDGQSATTLQGEPVEISVVDGGVVLNGSVNVTATDILATNGVIHVIDAVLLPPSVVASMQAPEEMEAPGFVNIRVAHLSPDTPNVDVYLNGEAAITDLAFPNITGYVTIPAGSYEVAVAPAGTSAADAAIGPATLDLPAGEFLTIAAIGSLTDGTLAPAIITDDFSELAEGSARVTVFHAIEDAPTVDVLADGAVIVPGLAFPGTLGNNDGVFTLDVPAGTYNLAVVPTGETEPVVIDLSGTTLDAGSHYFVAAVGTLDAPSVALSVVDAMTADTLSAAVAPAMEEPAQTILDIAVSNPDFSILVAAVQAADPAIAEALSGEGPLTVFAPTNAAFEALLAQLNMSAEDLLANTEILNQVLLYHVVSGSVLAADVVGMDGQSAPTLLEGETVSISVVDGGVVLNDSVNVVATDIVASNGVIHVIDGVLVPQVVLSALGM